MSKNPWHKKVIKNQGLQGSRSWTEGLCIKVTTTFCSAFSFKEFAKNLSVQGKELKKPNKEAKLLIRDLSSLLSLNRQKSEFENDKAQRTCGVNVMEGRQMNRHAPDIGGPSPFWTLLIPRQHASNRLTSTSHKPGR